MENEKKFPTMIIPAGTEVSVNENGQLSIRTPGNLVIQNSGVYSIIESSSGSVRIDPGVKVEAVTVQAADSCFVAGELTAWRVKADRITLEKGAQANIMLQESEALELDRNARLVGNFASEKELYLMLGRFSRQLRDLPESLGPGQEGSAPARMEAPRAQAASQEEPFQTSEVSPDGEGEPTQENRQQQAEVLSLVRVVLERELGRSGLDDGSRESLQRLLELVRSERTEPLAESYRYLLSQVDSPSDDLASCEAMLGRLFARG